ncbi:MAG: peptidylprolyl isomerase [Opitutae bacterium]|nr:peptidylprolyl isomerase [Opitutae bacterium]
MNPRHFSFHYTLRDAAGRILDTSRGGEPADAVEGAGQIIDGLEAELVTMTPGERRAVVVPPERGYGPVEEALRQRVPRSRLPVAEVKAGDRFQTGPDRHAPVVTVVAVEGDAVWLDANHPLAGQPLHFEVELVAVRPAAPEERAASRNGGLD